MGRGGGKVYWDCPSPTEKTKGNRSAGPTRDTGAAWQRAPHPPCPRPRWRLQLCPGWLLPGTTAFTHKQTEEHGQLTREPPRLQERPPFSRTSQTKTFTQEDKTRLLSAAERRAGAFICADWASARTRKQTTMSAFVRRLHQVVCLDRRRGVGGRRLRDNWGRN